MPLPETQSRLPKVLARDQVYQQLRFWLVEGVLKPGEKLNHHDIGKRLGFSAIPIREACMRLHYEGFVEMAHSRWTRVVPLNIRKTFEIRQTAEALELYALELAMPLLQAADLRRLRLLNQDLQEALESNRTREALFADRSFHAVWVDRSPNRELVRQLADLKDHLQIAETELFGNSVLALTEVSEHEGIINGLAHGDTVRVAHLLRDHWHKQLVRLQEQNVSETGSDRK